jgi:hypothetical protein
MSFSNVNFDHPQHMYAVFAYSLKKNKFEFDLLIMVLPIKRCVEGQLQRGHRRKEVIANKKWARVMKCYQAFEGVQFFERRCEAYAYATKFRNRVASSRLALIYGDGERKFSVYCHPLIPAVISDSDFKRQNPNLSPLSLTENNFYVGQTGLSVLQRIENHMNSENDSKTKWGQEYFVGRNNLREFELGRTKGERLTLLFEQATGLHTSNLLYSESMVIEAIFARWIKDQGHNAYFA